MVRFVFDMRTLALLAVLVLPSVVASCCKDNPTSSPGGSLPTVRVSEPKRFALAGPSSNHLLADRYPRSGVRIELAVRYTQPGTILDTVGIAAAKTGSFAILILPTGHVQAQVYDPGQSSAAKIANGWHVMKSAAAIPKDNKTSVVFETWKGDMALWVGGKLASRINLATELSGDPVYLGDFPGDASFAPRYNTNTGMTGTVEVAYFGKLDPKTYVADRGLKVGP
jgi:hypothetical protein